MRGWIPPAPLVLAMAAFGFSWIVLFDIARVGSFTPSLAFFGWLHLVALGWITLIAISVLLHVIPAFLGVEWHADVIARNGVLAFAFGVAVLVFGFLTAALGALQIGGTIAALALFVYVTAVVQPLRAALRGGRLQRAVGRALGVTIALLALTAALGAMLTYALAGHVSAHALQGTPPAHAFLGIGGWLTLLVLGVFARTMIPIAGVRSRWPVLHRIAGTCAFVGTIVAAIGVFADAADVLAIGSILLLLATVVFTVDVGDVLRRATVSHKPPQALMGCAALWAVISAGLAVGAVYGKPWTLCAIYAALIGWIGSAVLAHLHHIGIRVLVTNVLGDENETPPDAVLFAPLTWSTAVFYEMAAFTGSIGVLLRIPRLVEIAASSGFLAFLLILVNVTLAVRSARRIGALVIS